MNIQLNSAEDIPIAKEYFLAHINLRVKTKRKAQQR
jgi:hypothetical protein